MLQGIITESRGIKNEAIFNSSNQDLEDGKNVSGFSFIFHAVPFVFMWKFHSGLMHGNTAK